MEFVKAFELLQTRFEHYKAYIAAHPEFATHKPMFILALGVGTGAKIERDQGRHTITKKLRTGYIQPSAYAMVQGIDRGAGFELTPYSDDRHTHKYISFVLAFDDTFNKHYYQYEFFNNFKNANPELYLENYYKPQSPVSTTYSADLPPIHEPTGVSPSNLNGEERFLRHVLQDSYTTRMIRENPYKPENPPNFYNIFCVNEYLPLKHKNNKNHTKHKALRVNGSPRTFNAIMEGCEIDPSYPLARLRDILSEIIEMGGVIGVQNDAYWMTPYGVENYYFENMCEIPKLLSEYNPLQIYRFEMVGAEERETFQVTPFFTSIPEVEQMKKYNPYHRSTRTQEGWQITSPYSESWENLSGTSQNPLSPEPSWRGRWEGNRWVPTARRGGSTRRRSTKRRSRLTRRRNARSRKHYN